MKLILNQEKEISNPSIVQIKASFGRLFRRPQNKIELQNGWNERLIFRWDNYIGISADLHSFNNIVARDSVLFLSFKKAIMAAQLFANGNKGWIHILKIKETKELNVKPILKRIIKYADLIGLTLCALFISLVIGSQFSSGFSALFDSLMSNANTFYFTFAVIFYVLSISKLPHFFYRYELSNTTNENPPSTIFFYLIMALIFTIYFFIPPV